MGHVDAGKTKLLDFVRGTNVLEGEAGFLTQQIGATYFPAENIRERTKELKADAKMKVPGLLVIDIPGHESFTNLRNVVDIMEGLKPQTIESLNLLKMRNTEFIVALNKVDRLYGWKMCRNAPIVKALKQQSKDVRNQFKMKLIEKAMVEKLTFSNEVQCTVLEVKVIEGHGTTIDVVLELQYVFLKGNLLILDEFASIENNRKPVEIAKKGQKVSVKIVGSNPEEPQKMFGRHFDLEDELDDLSLDERKLVVKLKNIFKIQ
ncbi:hypothetical protein ACOSQ4_017315 [Xanthoceras sorbifolium]